MNRHVKTRHFGLLFVFAGLFLVAACTADEGLPEYVERPVDEIYNDALNVLQDGIK